MRSDKPDGTAIKRVPFGLPDLIWIILLGFFSLILIVSAALPWMLHVTPYAVSSVSMEPTLSRGDLVFVKPVSVDEVKKDGIVAFQTESGVVIHRIFSIDRDSRTFRTKADSSNQPDTQPISETQLLGEVVYKIPLLGYPGLWVSGEGTDSQ